MHRIHSFKVQTSVVISTFIWLCSHHYFVIFNISITPDDSTCQIAIIPCPFPHLTATTYLFYISMDLPILGNSHKWNHIICSLQGLYSFTYHHALRFINVVIWISTSFFFLANCYSWYGQTRVLKYVYQLMNIYFLLLLKMLL